MFVSTQKERQLKSCRNTMEITVSVDMGYIHFVKQNIYDSCASRVGSLTNIAC